MATIRGARLAFGSPGIEPRWTYANKEGVGTAYSAPSRIWFTLLGGIVTEIYCPTVDRAQVRDLQFLVTDGESFVHEERMHMTTTTEALAPSALGYRVFNVDPQRRYSIEKTIITDPHYPSVLQRVRVQADDELRDKLRVFVLCAPHLEVGGWNNNAYVIEMSGRQLLAAEKNGTWLLLDAGRPFRKLSCGYVGHSDGWTDLADNFQMDWEFDRAENGNVALIGEIENPFEEFVVALTLGNSQHNALTTLYGSLYTPFDRHEARFIEQWARSTHHMLPLGTTSGDGGRLYASSYSLLMAHEDKTYPGAMIAPAIISSGPATSPTASPDCSPAATSRRRAARCSIWQPASATTAAFRRICGSTEMPTGQASISTKSRFRFCWRAGCIARTCCITSIPIGWRCARRPTSCITVRQPTRSGGKKPADTHRPPWRTTSQA